MPIKSSFIIIPLTGPRNDWSDQRDGHFDFKDKLLKWSSSGNRVCWFNFAMISPSQHFNHQQMDRLILHVSINSGSGMDGWMDGLRRVLSIHSLYIYSSSSYQPETTFKLPRPETRFATHSLESLVPALLLLIVGQLKHDLVANQISGPWRMWWKYHVRSERSKSPLMMVKDLNVRTLFGAW